MDNKFITESALWQGGLYERMIKFTKKLVQVAVGRRLLKEEQLKTLVCEVEEVLNTGHPLI